MPCALSYSRLSLAGGQGAKTQGGVARGLEGTLQLQELAEECCWGQVNCHGGGPLGTTVAVGSCSHEQFLACCCLMFVGK